jgi:hypothetical protein
MNEVKALLFDAFGTVVDWRRVGGACEAAPFLARHGAGPAPPAAFAMLGPLIQEIDRRGAQKCLLPDGCRYDRRWT